MRRCTCVLAPSVLTFTQGEAGTKAWRMFMKSKGSSDALISAWHDLPLRADATAKDGAPTFWFVPEIPKGTRAKLELSKEEAHNPIVQDIFKKEPAQPLRYFAYGDMPFNYGFLPRTWENPEHTDPDTACNGDGDPIDAVHIGPVVRTGEVCAVRVLGVLGLIDQGETDWKIIVESVGGDERGTLSNVPQSLQHTVIDWFRNYKVPDGKKPNDFAFGGHIRDVDYALKVIDDCAQQYEALRAGKIPNTHKYWIPRED